MDEQIENNKMGNVKWELNILSLRSKICFRAFRIMPKLAQTLREKVLGCLSRSAGLQAFFHSTYTQLVQP